MNKRLNSQTFIKGKYLKRINFYFFGKNYLRLKYRMEAALLSYSHNSSESCNIFPTNNINNNNNTLEQKSSTNSANFLLSPFQLSSIGASSKSSPSSPPIVSSYSKMFSPTQMHNSILSQYAAAAAASSSSSSSSSLSSSDQQQISATSLAAAAQLAAEMHHNRYTYQQNLDFLKIFAPTSSSSSTMSLSQQGLTSPSANHIYGGSPISPKLNLLAAVAATNPSADKLLGSGSHAGLGGILTSHSNVYLPNEDTPFYNAVSASFVGRLASEIFFLNH
jgi:hypothetical protein